MAKRDGPIRVELIGQGLEHVHRRLGRYRPSGNIVKALSLEIVGPDVMRVGQGIYDYA